LYNQARSFGETLDIACVQRSVVQEVIPADPEILPRLCAPLVFQATLFFADLIQDINMVSPRRMAWAGLHCCRVTKGGIEISSQA
jgi:hypothetical protein